MTQKVFSIKQSMAACQHNASQVFHLQRCNECEVIVCSRHKENKLMLRIISYIISFPMYYQPVC